MSTLRRGAIRIKNDDAEPTTYAVDGGYIEADGQKVVVLASRAIDMADIDVELSRDRITANQERIEKLEEGNPAIAFAKAEIAWQEHLISLKAN
jgi:F-type H+-transporting ATPase subunit epsilon